MKQFLLKMLNCASITSYILRHMWLGIVAQSVYMLLKTVLPKRAKTKISYYAKIPDFRVAIFNAYLQAINLI